jgi:hypothetical protein
VKVGQTVEWDTVPDGALVRDRSGDYAIRQAGRGQWVCLDWTIGPEDWHWWDWVPDYRMRQEHGDLGPVTIVARGVPLDVTPEDLKRLAT